ncbi:MurR/RpiR family transcriptional regulator [Pleomorphomonas diazotrophica]|uniref:MurR/RpiR family transcriptional regulator n=2 Tax=Pleomorphomonas diazotrophica TaxID=1166257 RepID=A0A2N3LXS7_9HYPH|nr:MurR/RpiR family transcriptional regulator [Pleomorphomonas diazotrophica]
MKENFHEMEKMKKESASSRDERSDMASGGVDARIAALFDDLTESEKRLAEVVLEAAGDLSAFTAGELAARAEVSAATAARFFRRLGYESYGDLRRSVRDARTWGSPLYELSAAEQPADFARHIAQDVENLQRLAVELPPTALAAAVDILVSAGRLHVIGFRNSAALAAYARGLLAHVKPDVRLLPLAGQTLAEDIADLGGDDVLLVFGFRRRPPMLRDVMAAVRDTGARILLVTDASAARTAHLAHVTLRCPNKGDSLFDSYVAPMSLISHLASATGAALGKSAESRLATIEDLHRRLEPFLSGRHTPGR